MSVRRQCQQRRWWLPVVGRAGIAIDGRAAVTCEPSHGLHFRVELVPGLAGRGCRRALVGQILDARRAA